MSFSLRMAEALSKLHFVAALGMFLFIALMVVSDDLHTRAFLLIPVVLLYGLSKIMYAIDQKTSTDRIVKHYKKKR
jgi:Sec-independent protein secretion pathway component TatC